MHPEIARTSLYFHIPFCRKRCLYCDFVTAAGRDNLIPEYMQALHGEVEQVSAGIPDGLGVHTVYFGGGTPSVVPAKAIQDLLNLIRTRFSVTQDAEITLEMNPGTVDERYLHDLFQSGVNRLSIGMQSAVDSELRFLGRIHDTSQFERTVELAESAGFENISFDLIFGIPGQTLKRWEASLRKAIDLRPKHLSLYSLTIEEGTTFGDLLAQGKLHKTDDDTMADMYELAGEILENGGYQQYEISNWAATGREVGEYESRHNLQYWRRQPYLGFGIGAHGNFGRCRYFNTVSIEEYIQKSSNPTPSHFPRSFATAGHEEISDFGQMQETMMLGLRLTREGVSGVDYFSRYGKEILSVFGEQIHALVELGLLEALDDDQLTIRLTQKGRLLGNQVFMRFVGD